MKTQTKPHGYRYSLWTRENAGGMEAAREMTGYVPVTFANGEKKILARLRNTYPAPLESAFPPREHAHVHVVNMTKCPLNRAEEARYKDALKTAKTAKSKKTAKTAKTAKRK